VWLKAGNGIQIEFYCIKMRMYYANIYDIVLPLRIFKGRGAMMNLCKHVSFGRLFFIAVVIISNLIIEASDNPQQDSVRRVSRVNSSPFIEADRAKRLIIEQNQNLTEDNKSIKKEKELLETGLASQLRTNIALTSNNLTLKSNLENAEQRAQQAEMNKQALEWVLKRNWNAIEDVCFENAMLRQELVSLRNQGNVLLQGMKDTDSKSERLFQQLAVLQNAYEALEQEKNEQDDENNSQIALLMHELSYVTNKYLNERRQAEINASDAEKKMMKMKADFWSENKTTLISYWIRTGILSALFLLLAFDKYYGGTILAWH
jgi:chromosome segregation ATPase